MYLGRIMGALFGFLFGRVVGALLGFAVGWWFDRGYAEVQRHPPNATATRAAFLDLMFEILGHLAKAKGRVTEDDIAFANARFRELQLDATAKQAAMAAFQRGKQSDYPLRERVRALRQMLRGKPNLLSYFVTQLITAALLDDQLEPAEQQVISDVAMGLGLSAAQVQQILRMAQAQQQFHGYQQGRSQASSAAQLESAYGVLGLTPTASAAEVKKAYRRLMAKHHPDKLAAQGLPPEMRASAQAKAQEIQAAYELIKKQQGSQS